MSEKLDNVLQQMQELTETVKEHNEDRATLEMERVTAQFQEQVDALTEEVKALKERPVYRVPGEAIDKAGLVLPGSNRYARMVKDFERDGYHKVGNGQMRPLDLWLAGYVMEKGHALMPDRAEAPSDDLKAAMKAMYSTGSGVGDELVPTGMASELWEEFFLASKIAALFQTVAMPTNPFDVPLGLGDTTWRKGTENLATSATDLTTAKSTLTATELVTEVNWSYTLQEDAIVALMPAVRARLSRSGAEIIDDFAYNADSTNAASGNINCYDANPPDNAYYLSDGQDGIRHQWIVDNTSQRNDASAALADSHILAALAKMGKWAVDPSRCVIICDVNTYLIGLLGNTNCRTVDKYGPGATILTGELARYSGIPIVVSASARLGSDADYGAVDSAGGTRGVLTITNRDAWIIGFRRNLLIEVDRDIRKRQYIMVVSLREAIAANGTRSSNTHTTGIFDITV
jgi:HK97 family phage major capsid protein